MLPFGRPAVFSLTPNTPARVTYEHGISPKHTLCVHDLDGQGREWEISGTVAKVSIFNSKNLTLRLPGRIVTSMVEMHNVADFRLMVGTSSASEPPAPLGTLQLDPDLRNVKIEYGTPSSVGKVVLAPLLTEDDTGRRSFGLSQLSLQAGDNAPFVLADAEGRLCAPQSKQPPISPMDPPGDLPRQWVLSYGDVGWTSQGLRRGDKDYPQLA